MQNDKLIIWLQDAEINSIQWLILNSSGELINGPHTGVLADLSSLSGQYQVIVLVPSTVVSLSQVKLPHTQRKYVAQAALYALEEYLAEDIQELHIALADSHFDGNTAVAIISRELLTQWLQQLETVAIIPTIMLPDVLAISLHANSWSILLLENSALVRINHTQGFAVEEENLRKLLELKLSKMVDKPGALEIQGSTVNMSDDFSEFKIPVHYQQYTPATLLMNFAREISVKAPINLLQGDFRVKHQMVAWKKTWRITGIVASLWLMISIVCYSFQYIGLNIQQSHLQQKISAQYFALYPQATTLVSPRSRMEQELNQLHSAAHSNAFLHLLATAGSVFQLTPAVTMQGLEFSNQELTVSIITTDFKTLQKVTNALSSKGLLVKTIDASSDGKNVTAKLQISEVTS